MKKRIPNRFFLAIAIVLSVQFSFAQSPDSLKKSQNYWFTGQYTFANSCVGNTISSRGLTLNLGFNIAKLFSDQIILGITADLKVFPGLWKPKTTSSFLNDFNNNLSDPQNNFDSINLSIVSQNLNQGGLVGNNRYFIGGMLSLFPNSCGGLLFEAKYGRTDFQARKYFPDRILRCICCFGLRSNQKPVFPTAKSRWRPCHFSSCGRNRIQNHS